MYETKGAFHLIKNSGVNFRKFLWANGTNFSSVEDDKSHSFVRLEFFNDFEVQIANIEANRTLMLISRHRNFLYTAAETLYKPQRQRKRRKRKDL